MKRLLLILVTFALASCTDYNVAVVETTTAETDIAESAANLSENVPKLDGLQIVDIEKYGNIVLPISATDFLNSGFNYEDIVTVSFLDRKIDMPVCDTYFDVDSGDYVLMAEINKETNVDKIVVAISMGDFATTNKLAVQETLEDGIGYKWNYLNDYDKTCTFTIELKEKGGYHADRLAHQLIRTNEREDYKNLSDEEFANFRMIKTSGIGENKIFRSSSPVNSEIGRGTYAMKATEDHGIKTIVNLADTGQEVKDRDTYKDSFYSKQKVIAAGLNIDFNSTTFKEGLARAIHSMADSEAPFLIHCNEGKDRAGYLSALIECLMGASLDEVVEDYMITYYNYYNVVPGTEQYDAIRDKKIIKQLKAAFEVNDLANANLSQLCEKFLRSIGVTEEDIKKLKLELQ